VPKIGALIALYRFLGVIPDARVDWRLLLAVLATASMTLGNLAAFAQTSPLRLLGWSTVSQVGYLLMAVSVALRPDALPSLTFYLAAYAVTNLGAFAVAAALPTLTTLRSYAGLGRRRPWLAAALVICLLGLVGTPPTAVFIGKLTVFSATWSDGLGWLVVVAAVNTVASLFYYLRWIAPAIGVGTSATRTVGEAGTPVDRWAAGTAAGAATLSVALGIAAASVLDALPLSLLR
jgi:NADH-quinone oxidoreductase subunit N